MTKLQPAKVLKIKPKGRYLVIFDKADAGGEHELTQLNESLKDLFGSAKVLAIFTKDVNSVKIAELIKEENKDEN